MTGSFDDLMGEIELPMIVVTTVSGDERSGCLVGFHVQCGMVPSRYAVWLSKANHTYRIGILADVFAIHFLRRSHRPLAELFGTTTGDEVDKFTRCAWTPGPEGVPLLDGCDDRVVGRRVGVTDVDTDHVCFVLEPIDVTMAAAPSPADPFLRSTDLRDLEAGHEATERQEG